MTIALHAVDTTECDHCDQPIGKSRLLSDGHVVCFTCGGGTPATSQQLAPSAPPAATVAAAPTSATPSPALAQKTLRERVADAVTEQHGRADSTTPTPLMERVVEAMGGQRGSPDATPTSEGGGVALLQLRSDEASSSLRERIVEAMEQQGNSVF